MFIIVFPYLPLFLFLKYKKRD